MKRLWTLVMALLGAVLLTPRPAASQDTLRHYSLDWTAVSFVSQNSCLVPQLQSDEQFMFSVNAMPLPTRAVDQAFRRRTNGDLENRFKAMFSGSLLRWGSNDILFGVTTAYGMDYCTFAEDTVDLNSSGLPTRRLFLVTRNGQPFLGVAPLHLDLREINPRLADSLAQFEEEVNRELRRLGNLSADLQYAQQHEQELKALLAEVTDLCKRPLDSITEAELRALMDKYGTLSSTVRNRLAQVLADVKKSLEELRAEIDRIVAGARAQMDVLDQWGLTEPPTGGVDMGNPDTYEPDLDPSQVDEVEVPDVSSGDVFDEDNDPYRAFAEQTLGELRKSVSNGTVVDRQGFLAMVRLWRFNQRVFEEGLRSRIGVSQAEWGAFLLAQQLVLNELRLYMDADDWFLDAPMRQSTRAFIAVLGQRPQYAAQARLLKNNLNLWQGQVAPGSTQDLVLETLDGLSGGLHALDEGAAEEDPTLLGTYFRLLDGAVTITKEAALIGVSLTPVGDIIDLCEALTGRELCNPNGRELEVSERVFAGAGVVIGSKKFWMGVSAVATTVVGMAVSKRLVNILDGLVDLTLEQKKLIRDRLGDKAFERMEFLKGQEILTLMDRTLKDANIKLLSKRLDGRMMKELTELKMVTVDPNILDFVKDKGAAVKNLGPMYQRTVADVQAELLQAGFILKSKTATQEIWTHTDHSLVRIAKSTELSPYLHIKKEITDIAGASEPQNVLVKLTETKQLVPPTPNTQLEMDLAAWYQGKTSFPATRLIREEYPAVLAMQQAWAYATHIELKP